MLLKPFGDSFGVVDGFFLLSIRTRLAHSHDTTSADNPAIFPIIEIAGGQLRVCVAIESKIMSVNALFLVVNMNISL